MDFIKDTRAWAAEEVGQLKQAPVGIGVLLAIGLAGGWFVHGEFVDRELGVMRSLVEAAGGGTVFYQSSIPAWWHVVGYITMALLAFVIGVGVGRKAKPMPSGGAANGLKPIRVLERFYMVLADLKDHTNHLVGLKELGDDPHESALRQVESGLERIRAELMNLSPSLLPTATALDFYQKRVSVLASGYGATARAPQSIDELMEKVLRCWRTYAERIGIAPISFTATPIVKFQDE